MMLRSPVGKPFPIAVNEEDRPKDTRALKRQPLGDDAAAKSVLNAHVRRLRELGATGKADISVEMSLLNGKEQEVVEWLESTVAAIHEAARHLPPGEE